MHEFGIAQEIVRAVQEHAKRSNAQQVLGAVIFIGRLSGVVSEALQFCLSVCVKGTPLESADFKLEHIPALARCKECLTHFDPVMHEFVCPVCKQSNWHIVSGRELFIKEIEVV